MNTNYEILKNISYKKSINKYILIISVTSLYLYTLSYYIQSVMANILFWVKTIPLINESKKILMDLRGCIGYS